MGEEGRTPPWVVIITSVLSLIGVIVTGYFGYLQVKEKNSTETPANIGREEPGHEEPVRAEPGVASAGNALIPVVEYSLNRYSGAHLRIGNTAASGIIVVSDLTVQWDYRECPRREEPRVGAVLVPYRYTVDVTQSRGSKLLDDKTFKYGPGDLDEFFIDVNFPGLGIYTIWIEFKYVNLGETSPRLFQTPKESEELC